MGGIFVAIVDRADRFSKRAKPVLAGLVAFLLVGSAVALASHDDGSDASGSGALGQPNDGALLGGSGDPAQGGGSVAPTPTVPGAPPTSTAPTGAQASGATATTIDPTVPSIPKEPYVYEVTLEPTCTRAGGQFTLTVRVKPWTNVGVVVSYADNDTHGTQTVETAGEDGIVVRTLPAPLSAVGPGRVLTGATQAGTYASGGTSVDFRIVGLTETC